MVLAIALLAAFAAFQWWFTAGFYPGSGGALGYDYGYYFPRMVTAELALRAGGPLAVPWFTPALCAGGFQAANPIAVTYSLPQLLSLASDPLLAARLTHVLVVVGGALGAGCLARYGLGLGGLAAVLVALVFGCNEFIAARLIIGHLNFHTFMLLPWIAWALLGARHALHWPTWVAGMLLAVSFWGGGAHVLPPMGLALLMVVLLSRLLQPQPPPARQQFGVLAAAPLLGAALSGPKLVTGIALIAQLPRPDYGIAALPAGHALTFGPLAVFTPLYDSGVALLGSRLRFDAVEFEYGLTPGVLALFVAAALGLAATRRRRLALRPAVVALVLLALLPVVLNLYHPGLQSILERLPVLGDSTLLLRWYCAWLLPLALLAGMALQVTPVRLARPLGLAVCASAPLWLALQDWQRLQPGTFDYPTLLAGLQSARAGADVRITRLDAVLDTNGISARADASRDVGVAGGTSQVFCYESLFGYFHEHLVTDDLRRAPPLSVHDGYLNFKNPACYVFGAANHCRPGDRFRPDQRDQAARFLAFEPLEFERPWWLRVAALVAAAGWLLALGVLAASAVSGLDARRRSRRAAA